MHLHSFKTLHRQNVNDSTGQVVGRLSGWRFYLHRRVRIKGLTLKKRKFDVHSHCFQDTELKLHRYMSKTPPDRSWKGWQFYRTPEGVRNKGLTTHKSDIIFYVHSHSFQDTELKLHRYTSATPQDMSWRGWRTNTILSFPRGVRNKELISQKTIS